MEECKLIVLRGIKLKDNLIAVRSSDIKDLSKGDKLNVLVKAETYKCVVDSKELKSHENGKFKYYSVEIKCTSHPETKVTEYTSIG